jgi:hypothetical protein
MFRPVRPRAVLRTAPDLNGLVTIRAANKPFLVTKIQVVADPVGQCEVALRLLPKSGENLIFRRRSS